MRGLYIKKMDDNSTKTKDALFKNFTKGTGVHM